MQLLKKIEASMTVEDCDEIIGMCSTVKAALDKAKKQPTKKASAAPKTKSKKDLKAEQAAHAELFGGFVEDEYDELTDQHLSKYDNSYDDFM